MKNINMAKILLGNGVSVTLVLDKGMACAMDRYWRMVFFMSADAVRGLLVSRAKTPRSHTGPGL